MTDSRLLPAAATESIEVVHQLIYRVFTTPGAEGESALQELLTWFSPDFTMTGISGAVVDYKTVAEMFGRAQGQRQGAPIETSDYTCIRQNADTCCIRYREIQHFGGTTTERISLVILVLNPSRNRWQWQYLHETPRV